MAIHVVKRPHAPVPAPRSTPPPAAPTPAEAQPLFDRAYWIAHSEGYRVDAGNRRLGFVEETFANPDREGQMLLVIRGGALGRRLYAARSEDVVMIVPRAADLAPDRSGPLRDQGRNHGSAATLTRRARAAHAGMFAQRFEALLR